MVLAFGLAGLAATPAQAEDDVFGYTYAAETLTKGETEMELWATDRRGKDTGHYDAQDYKVELEHGITDRFTVSAYANFVERGATAVAGPQNRPAWQVRSAHLSDPDGYLVEIYSQLAGAEAHQA